MSDSVVSISRRFDDQTLLSIGGKDAEDFRRNLITILGGENAKFVWASFADLVPASAGGPVTDTADPFETATKNVKQAFPEAEPYAEDEPPNTSTRTSRTAKAAPSTQRRKSAGPPPGPKPECDHGERVWVSGISKRTKQPFKMWACPLAQDDPDKCEPDFDV